MSMYYRTSRRPESIQADTRKKQGLAARSSLSIVPVPPQPEALSETTSTPSRLLWLLQVGITLITNAERHMPDGTRGPALTVLKLRRGEYSE